MNTIKPLQCGQCGSHDIREANGRFVCTYCGTVQYGGTGKITGNAWRLLRVNRVIAIAALSVLLVVVAASVAYFTGGKGPGPGGTTSSGEEAPGGIIEKGGDSIEPEKKISAEFRDIAALHDGIGNIYFVGMLANTGETPVYPRAEIALLDARGKKAAVARGYGIRGYLLPGEKTPVQVLVTAAPDYSSLRSIGVAEVPSYMSERPKLTITGLAMKRPESRIDRYKVTGVVKNSGGKNARYVQIAVVVFDEAGKIIGYSSNFLGQTVLTAGDEAPFKVEIHLMKGRPARYMVEYNALPDRASD